MSRFKTLAITGVCVSLIFGAGGALLFMGLLLCLGRSPSKRR